MLSCIFQSLPYTRWDTVFYADCEMGGKTDKTGIFSSARNPIDNLRPAACR